MRYIFLIRAHQWVKNLFIFLPVFFSGDILNFSLIFILFQGFICFCLVSSSIYILNDYFDRATDRNHPVKKNRPLASGKISVPFAMTVMALFATVGMGWAFVLSVPFFLLLLLYVFINIGYSLGLKNISLIDVFLVSSGFLIRAVAGGVLVNIFISQWLIIMVFLLSLLLSFAKRRDDLVAAQVPGVPLRRSCKNYNLDFINISLSLISGVILVAYIMYTFSADVQDRIGENYLYITSLFVFIGILRYLQVTLVNHGSGSPTRVFLTDRIIQFTVVGWVLAFFTTLYV